MYQRSHRPGTELCFDQPHDLLVKEVHSLQGKFIQMSKECYISIFSYSLESLDLIDGKIKQAEAAKLDLENNKINLEQEIRLKEFSLELDQSKCLTMRQNFPFTTKCGLATKFNSIDRRRFRVNMKM